ncbi:MAG TPA: biopolymer transporter ExbD [Gemmatimonadales bacterium]|nr:biopolymer transporter ExbD [Gemmatimonadales bacterium]
MALAGLGRGRRKRHLNAEVNIINLVDVVLVLLIIFMVTAPMLQGGVEVRLPRAAARPMEAREGLTITVAKDGAIVLGDTRVTYEEFRGTLGAVIARAQPKGVYVRADEAAPYGDVLRVLALVRQAGVQNVGLVAEPEGRR